MLLREEVEAIYLTSNIADKLKYRVISKDDINISIDEDKLKKFWEERRDNFKNPKKYEFDIVWFDTEDINVTDDEVRKFYNENSYRYTSEDG